MNNKKFKNNFNNRVMDFLRKQPDFYKRGDMIMIKLLEEKIESDKDYKTLISQRKERIIKC